MYSRPLIQASHVMDQRRQQVAHLSAPITNEYGNRGQIMPLSTNFGSQRQFSQMTMSSQMPVSSEFSNRGELMPSQLSTSAGFGIQSQLVHSQMTSFNDFGSQRQLMSSQRELPCEFGNQRQMLAAQQMPLASDFVNNRQAVGNLVPMVNDLRDVDQMATQLMPTGQVGLHSQAVNNIAPYSRQVGGLSEVNSQQQRVMMQDDMLRGSVIESRLSVGDYPQTLEYRVNDQRSRQLTVGPTSSSIYQQLPDVRCQDVQHRTQPGRLDGQMGVSRDMADFRHSNLREDSRYQQGKFGEMNEFVTSSAARERYEHDGQEGLQLDDGRETSVRRQHEADINRTPRGRPTQRQLTDSKHTGSERMTLTRDGLLRSLSPQHKRRRSPDSNSQLSDSTTAKFRCQVCKTPFGSFKEFGEHMNSKEHYMNMQVLSAVYKDKNQQLLHSVQHYDTNNTESGANLRRQTQGCQVCDLPVLDVSIEFHIKSAEHKHKAFLVKKGCLLCHVHDFTNYRDYVRHIDSKPHKERKQQLTDRNRNTPGVKPTLAKWSKTSAGSKLGVGLKTSARSKVSTTGLKVNTHTSAEPKVSTASDIDLESKDVPKSIDKEDLSAQVPTQSEQPTLNVAVKCSAEAVDKSAEELVYNADTAVGVAEVISVTGFFCKLCHKFYNNETVARVTHCKSLVHFEKYVESLKRKQSTQTCSVDEVTTTQ